MAIFQAIYNMQATLYYMIYLIRFRPFEQKNMHNLEIFNETCYMLFGYTVLLFNPTLSGEAMFKMGLNFNHFFCSFRELDHNNYKAFENPNKSSKKLLLQKRSQRKSTIDF
jgi:hypothetical protein